MKNKILEIQDDFIETTMGKIPVIMFDSKYFSKDDAVRCIDALKNGYALKDIRNQHV
jgi:hypothetical protein